MDTIMNTMHFASSKLDFLMHQYFCDNKNLNNLNLTFVIEWRHMMATRRHTHGIPVTAFESDFSSQFPKLVENHILKKKIRELYS